MDNALMGPAGIMTNIILFLRLIFKTNLNILYLYNLVHVPSVGVNMEQVAILEVLLIIIGTNLRLTVKTMALI